jgi:hypothetical protein
MVVARFRPDNDVTFDFTHGLVHIEGAPARVLVPAEALGALCAAAGPEAMATFGRALGRAMGLRVAGRLGSLAGSGEAPHTGARAATVETMVDHLGGELSLVGLGSLSIERWGHALVVVVDHCPLGARGDALLEAVLSEAVLALAGRRVHAVLLARDGVRARFLLANGTAAERVRGWLEGGAGWGEALARLHAKPSDGPQPS